MRLKPEELPLVCDLVQELCGIALDNSKGYLIESRLGQICRRYDITSFNDLVKETRTRRGELMDDFVDAISTHETLFFRDRSLFQALKFKVLPELLDRKMELRRKTIRVLSAASSTGQEAYSIAMLLKELDVGPGWSIEIVGTDISKHAVKRAQEGVYLEHEVRRGLDEGRLLRFFKKNKDGWQVNQDLRSMCQFKTMDLQARNFSRGYFDLIMCRNVLIYFDQKTKGDVVKNLVDSLDREGYLIVGGSESLVEFGTDFRPHSHCGGVFYQPKCSRPKFV